MSQKPTLLDAKRAATLVVHWGRHDVDGVNHVLDAVNADADPSAATARLMFATLELFAGLVPLIHTPSGLALLTQMIVDLSAVDIGDER